MKLYHLKLYRKVYKEERMHKSRNKKICSLQKKSGETKKDEKFSIISAKKREGCGVEVEVLLNAPAKPPVFLCLLPYHPTACRESIIYKNASERLTGFNERTTATTAPLQSGTN